MTTVVTTGGQLVTSQQIDSRSSPLVWRGGGVVQMLGRNRVVSYDKLYRSQPVLSALINKIVRSASRLPLKAYRLDSQGNKDRVRDDDLTNLLARPYPRASTMQLIQWLMLPLYVHGNALTRQLRPGPGQPPNQLERLFFAYLEPMVSDVGGPVTHWLCNQRGKVEVLAVDDVVHVQWEASDSLIGVSPLEQLGVTLRIEDAAQRYQEANFGNGVRPSGAVEIDWDAREIYTRPERNRLREDIHDIYGSPDNAGLPLLLPPGMKWAEAQTTAADAELVQQRRVSQEEIAAVIDAPLSVVGFLERATHSNLEESNRALYSTTLANPLSLVERTLTEQLVAPEPRWEDIFLEFDMSAVMRGDTLKEINALKIAVTSGLMTINEARRVRNLPPIPHELADTVLVPANNLAPLDGIAAAIAVEDPALARQAAGLDNEQT